MFLVTATSSSDVRIGALATSINFVHCLSNSSDRDRYIQQRKLWFNFELKFVELNAGPVWIDIYNILCDSVWFFLEWNYVSKYINIYVFGLFTWKPGENTLTWNFCISLIVFFLHWIGKWIDMLIKISK